MLAWGSWCCSAPTAGYLTAPEDLHEARHCYTCRTDDCEYHD